MKSNNEHTSSKHVHEIDSLRTSIQQEKQELLSMFLASASLGELTEQFKRIDDLNARIATCGEPQ